MKPIRLFITICLLCTGGMLKAQSPDSCRIDEITKYDDIFYNLSNKPIPYTRSAVTDTAVGGMGGNFDVSPMGGAMYRIPIDVPVGVGGLQPELSIVYNSQSGTGLCGYGSTLAGISSITRGVKDIYHDGIAQGIMYQPDDALYLDGERLILSSGTPGQDGTIYNPESDPFTQVIAHGTCTSTSDNTSFEVKKSDGMVYWYGCGNTSRHFYNNGGTQKILKWYLDRSIQPSGNFINYYYRTIDNYVYLILIGYGTNLDYHNSPLSNLIFLKYQDTDSIPLYFDEQHGSLSSRLESIICTSNDSVYRIYTLDYDSIGDSTEYKKIRLKTVTVQNGDNEVLPATQFKWSNLPSLSYQSDSLIVYAPFTPNNVSLPFGDQIYVSGDLNNDGLDDIAGLTTEVTVNGQIKSFLNVYWAQNTASGISYSYGMLFEMPDLFNNTRFMERDKGDFHSFFDGSAIVEWDGDGYNEILLPFYETVSGNRTMGFYIQGCITPGVNCWDEVVRCPLSTSGGTLYSIADLNNDGRKDIMVLEKTASSGSYACSLLSYDPESSVGYRTATLQLSLPSSPKHVYLSDMNCNGMADLLVICNNHYVVFWNQGGEYISSTTFSDLNKRVGSNMEFYSMTTSGDFNGDGLLDILTNEAGTNEWYFNINNGNGTFNRMLACILNVTEQYFTDRDDDKFHCDVFDFDGDGKDDVVITKAIYEKRHDWGGSWGVFDKTRTYWMRSSGTSLELEYCASSNRADDALTNRFVSGDFNGDGLYELACYGYDCVKGINANSNPVWRLFKHRGYSAQSGKVISITGDYGVVTDITYSTLVDQDVYTLGTREQYPSPRYTIPLNVVKQIEQNNGAAGNLSIRYNYEGLKAHLNGRGVLGFSKSFTNILTADASTENGIIEWDTIRYIPKLTYSKTTQGNSFSYTKNTFSIVDKGNGKYFTFPSSVVETDMDGDSVVTNRSFNIQYGYLISENTTYGTDMYRIVTYSDYTYAGGVYRPQTVGISQRHPDDTSLFNSITKYEYNNYGNVTKMVENYGSSNPLTTNFSYDVFGNLTSKYSTGNYITNCTTCFEYDPTHRFVKRIYTNPSSSVLKYTYNIWGNVLTEIDSINSTINNGVTHTYDGWGNRTSTSTSYGSTVSYIRGWNNNMSQRWFVLEQGASRPWVKTWYDNQGREVKTESIGPMGVSIVNTNTYNVKGQLTSHIETEGNLTLTCNYTYDSRGRLSYENNSGGNSRSYSYGVLTGNLKSVTITETGGDGNTRTKTTTYDMWGCLKSVNDNGTTITNRYSSTGGIMSCIADSSTWTINYDERGNRSSISDPDAGTSYYTYDALGREISKTDGRGVVFVTNYDYLGRVTSISATKNNDTETITYSYGTSGTGQLRLVGRTLGSWSDSYEYDQYGRMITENEGGHTATFTYNAAGLISRMTWLSGGYTDHYVDFTYDTLGNCTSQSAINGAIQWNLTGYTGSTTTSTMRLHNNANLFTRTTSLDTYGNLSSQILTRGNTTLQSNGYTFNSATGNLTSRTLGGVTQNFTYDGVDRLKVVSSGNQTVMSMTYQSNGNIASKTGIGSYDYNTNYKPHAVQAVDNTLGLIPEGTQSVTYNLWGKVSEVSAVVGNDTYRYELTYGPDLQRVLAVLWKNNNLVHLITYGHDYEEKYQDGEITRYWYVNGTDGNRAVYTTHTQMGDKAYCMDMDHLGSVTAMYDQYGTKCYGASFDPWGKRTLMSGSIEFDRGFTGHEHIDEINLIDMNGRMYDPLIGRFLSPDNYIQSLGNPQNYNRYSYCLNNPLRYTDPSGEKISWLWGLAVALNIIPIESVIAYTTVTSTDAVTSATIGFIVGGIDESANRATNSIKIATGLLESDCKDGNELEQFGRSYFRSIWCSPTSLFGYAYATNANYFDRVDVEKLYGATVIRTKLVDGGVTFGHYINISSDYDIDDFMSTLIHEYGHFMQARDWGGFSALSGGVFSLVSAMDFFPRNGMGHKDMWIERDASARGARYLRGEYDSISTKYDQENPQGYYDLRMLHNMFIPFSVGFGIYNIFNPN